MSHVAKAKVTTKVAMKDEELLKSAIKSIGILKENEYVYAYYGMGFLKTKRYPLVLVSTRNPYHRIGYLRDKDGNWYPHFDRFGEPGQWLEKAAALMEDAYLACYYQRELEREGFDVSVNVTNDGTIEVLAEETAW